MTLVNDKPVVAAAPVAVSVDAMLTLARVNAEVELRLARHELVRHHPDRALAALHRAWDALSHVPGGEAFEDLLALNEATETVYQHLDAQHAPQAVDAMDEVIARLKG